MNAKRILLHLVLIGLVVAGIVFGTLMALDFYTRHGEFVEVPDFTGKKLRDLEAFVANQPVAYQVVDSVYDPREKPGIVLRQDPDPASKVKHNRKVYLYVTCQVPPQIQMPKLIDRSERQARFIIETYGLKVGRIEPKEADCDGCVVAQMVNGKDIAPGDPVKKGSVVSLMVGVKDAVFISDSTAGAADPNKND